MSEQKNPNQTKTKPNPAQMKLKPNNLGVCVKKMTVKNDFPILNSKLYVAAHGAPFNPHRRRKEKYSGPFFHSLAPNAGINRIQPLQVAIVFSGFYFLPLFLVCVFPPLSSSARPPRLSLSLSGWIWIRLWDATSPAHGSTISLQLFDKRSVNMAGFKANLPGQVKFKWTRIAWVVEEEFFCPLRRLAVIFSYAMR